MIRITWLDLTLGSILQYCNFLVFVFIFFTIWVFEFGPSVSLFFSFITSCKNLSIVTILGLKYCQNFIFLVLSHYEFLSFVPVWVPFIRFVFQNFFCIKKKFLQHNKYFITKPIFLHKMVHKTRPRLSWILFWFEFILRKF